jgi:tricorn protease
MTSTISYALPRSAMPWLMLVGLVANVATAESGGRRVWLAEEPHLSPDGKSLVFAWNHDLWQVDAAGGQAERLTSHFAEESQPKFSPDGKQIAFVSNRHGSRQIFVMPAEGGVAVQKSFHSEDYQLVDWFPDGRSLLAISARDHFWKSAERLIRISLEPEKKEAVLVDAHVTGASISPDGKTLLVTREGERWWRKGYYGERASQIWKLDLQTKQFTELLHEGFECRWPLWLPQEKGFYFTKGSSHGFDLWRYRFARDSKSPARQKKVVGFDDDSIVQPTIARDGSTIVFRHLFDLYRYRPGEKEAPQKLMITIQDEADREDLRRRTFEKADEVAFSSDGWNILFTAGEELWVMDTELREPIQLTDTDAYEREPIFASDGKTIWFTQMLDGQVDIWKLEKSEPKKPWWLQSRFIETRLTHNAATESRLHPTPDGQGLVFQENGGDLIYWELESGERRVLYDGFADSQFSISPDGRWLAYAASDEFFNRDIWLAAMDGSQLPVNVSQHPDNDVDPVFSPDGKILAFTGTRGDDEVDVFYVFLEERLGEETTRDRQLAKALEKESPKAKPKKEITSDTDSKLAGKDEPSAVVPLQVDLRDIHLRVKKIATPNSSDRGLLFSPDSKRLLFEAELEGKKGWFTVEFPDKLQPKFYSAKVLDDPVWLKSDDAILGSDKGVPARLKGESVTAFRFTAYHQGSRAERFRQGFQAAWLKMRDVWYDPKMGNRNWDAIRRKYAEAAAQAPTPRAFTTVIELMLGELNGSHLGFTPATESGANPQAAGDEWRPQVAHLGVRFEEDFAGPGLKVRDVLIDGPADRQASRLEPGEVILAIDGRAVDPSMDLSGLLQGVLPRDIELQVRSPAEKAVAGTAQADKVAKAEGGAERTIKIRPISYEKARELLYENWLADNRRLVEQQSQGRLGYLHIRAMDAVSFHEFETQLYRVGYGREGLLIDVRDNGGGSTTDYLLTALTQPRHAITIPRNGQPGYPQDRCVFATWTKPIVVLCNQNSFSNAEIFSHAIKALGRGKLVGVQTAGGVVSTGAASISDLGTLRVPFRGWFHIKTGLDFELNGAMPDVVIWPAPDEMPRGLDCQLGKAVELLLEEIAGAPKDPEAIYATSRSFPDKSK